MTHQEIYELLPVNQEFNSTDVNRLLGDKMVMESKHDTIPYKTFWKWSIDTESILSEMREKGMVARNPGVHCYWYIKIKR
jgi:hypothetical protein